MGSRSYMGFSTPRADAYHGPHKSDAIYYYVAARERGSDRWDRVSPFSSNARRSFAFKKRAQARNPHVSYKVVKYDIRGLGQTSLTSSTPSRMR